MNFFFPSPDWEKWQHSGRNHRRHQHHTSLRVWFLPVQSCRNSGEYHDAWLRKEKKENISVVIKNKNKTFVSGHQPSFTLLRAVGRQSLHGRRAPDSHLPAVPHVRALHPVRLHPGACILRPARGLPRTLPPGGQRARQVSHQASSATPLIAH